MADTLKQELIDIASALADASPDALQVAYHEDAAGGAKRFLKLNGQRLGRDLETYGFSGEKVAGWQETLRLFLEEVVLPLEDAAPEAYEAACGKLIEMGKKVFPADFQPVWEEILAPIAAP